MIYLLSSCSLSFSVWHGLFRLHIRFVQRAEWKSSHLTSSISCLSFPLSPPKKNRSTCRAEWVSWFVKLFSFNSFPSIFWGSFQSPVIGDHPGPGLVSIEDTFVFIQFWPAKWVKMANVSSEAGYNLGYESETSNEWMLKKPNRRRLRCCLTV